LNFIHDFTDELDSDLDRLRHAEKLIQDAADELANEIRGYKDPVT